MPLPIGAITIGCGRPSSSSWPRALRRRQGRDGDAPLNVVNRERAHFRSVALFEAPRSPIRLHMAVWRSRRFSTVSERVLGRQASGGRVGLENGQANALRKCQRWLAFRDSAAACLRRRGTAGGSNGAGRRQGSGELPSRHLHAEFLHERCRSGSDHKIVATTLLDVRDLAAFLALASPKEHIRREPQCAQVYF